jgi:hypothetical protein
MWRVVATQCWCKRLPLNVALPVGSSGELSQANSSISLQTQNPKP